MDKKSIHHRDLISVKEAAQMVGVSYPTMLKACKSCQSDKPYATLFFGRWIVNRKRLLERFGVCDE